jgi:hypothetical protein
LLKKIHNKLKRLNLTKIKAFFRINKHQNTLKTLIIASLALQDSSNHYHFNKIYISKFKKSLFSLIKKEKIILMRNTFEKTYFP